MSEKIMKLSPQKIIAYAKSQLVSNQNYMKDWAWLFPVIMLGKSEFTEDIPTAATNGLDVFYNPNYIKTLKFEQVIAVVLHENMHKIRRHLLLYKDLHKANPTKANIAMDVVINNQDLAGKTGVELGEGWVNYPKYADASIWTLKRIYDDLTDKDCEKYGGGQGMDIHDFESLKDLSPEELQKIEKQIDMAIRQASMTKAEGLPREIQELTVPEVDWKDRLSNFVKVYASGKDKQTWRRPHRQYVAHDLYLPDYYSETIGGVLVAMDTSGSIDNEMLSEFASHMNNLITEVNPSFVDVAYWGTSVTGVDEMKAPYGNIFANLQPKDGGGTDPACITQWLDQQNPRKEYVCAVVFTDGEFYSSHIGEWNGLPVLWIVVNTSCPEIPYGEVLHVKPR